ncbi:Nif3-like dinuclear metal center hexameric protein [Staphylococcus argensis]|uniref:GTP cyclohydrolase 1 type 2 homolog n=1 Tax=Staphylococcus argensis TaxID=1607738 RepID=A0A2K4FGM4_9STAP|nr:Nif3-like dinuclear metal center hexameric protein [Staphylococcus argensis]MCY6990569.1 Nif3-like dinuclear metal center hexameric protein [Staphylococcus argensis]POA10075.1 Nif3-like dinuclear metal center hexameric protein [Staphylococcus argensis]
MKLNQLLTTLNEHVPFNTAESWDNVGLLIGDEESEVTGIVTALDCTEVVVDEAIELGYNTIISHHPLIFKGVQNIIQQEGYGAIIRKLIQHDINLIALHTNLDVYPQGVNAMLAERLQLGDVDILNPQTTEYYKVQVFIPETDVETFKNQLSQHGLAQEGNYEACYFQSLGKGQFKPVGDANPTLGEVGEVEHVDEMKVEFMIAPNERQLAQRMIEKYHPYETPVYDIMHMTKLSERGLGVICQLDHSMDVPTFVNYVKSQLDMPSVRFIGDTQSQIETVAIIGGAGVGFESHAHHLGADIFITGDIKHHDALDAKIAGMNMLDINHYSEYVMKEGLVNLLNRWYDHQLEIPVKASEHNTDPYTYY